MLRFFAVADLAPESSCLVVSLDFELFWGVRDVRRIDEYRANILGVREAIPRMLELFEQFDIHATWATVGFLFCSGSEELRSIIPKVRPEYRDERFSPYSALDQLGRTEADDPLHFAPSLIQKIAEAPGQEIATHTLSHYYCLEPGQTVEAFRADILAARALARKKLGVEIFSLVFPRNQFSRPYLLAAKEAGIRAFRGNPSQWMYAPKNEAAEWRIRLAARLADSYLPIHQLSMRPSLEVEGLTNVPATRFLRAYSPRLRALETVKTERIAREIRSAAKTGAS